MNLGKTSETVLAPMEFMAAMDTLSPSESDMRRALYPIATNTTENLASC